jgi:deferrochelatase/peroxidase EfeB
MTEGGATNDPKEAAEPSSAGLSRRKLIGLAGVSALAGAGLTAGVSAASDSPQPSTPPSHARDALKPVPFYGEHQAGIVTPAQDRLHFAAYDLLPGTTRADVITLLQEWTAAAAAMTAGQPIGGLAGSTDQDSPPDDTGEAEGLPPSSLTVTVGFGNTFFEKDGQDRFGIKARRPAAMEPLPHFSGDQLDPANSNGDLVVQACADDPQVAVHAIRNLTRIAHGTALVRYSQLGFGRTSSTTTAQATPRNLFGFKDGTANLKAEDPKALEQFVWVHPSDDQGSGAKWMTGGSYLVSRRIRMTIETWDHSPLNDQETTIGRRKLTGAPLGAEGEFDPVDFKATGVDGETLIPEKAHVRMSHPSTNGGAQLLRRGYSFVDGSDALGRLNAGLFFIAYQRDPRQQFTVIQNHLAGKANDALNEYITHVASGLYAVPPGVQPGQYWGQGLFS